MVRQGKESSGREKEEGGEEVVAGVSSCGLQEIARTAR